MINRHSLRRHCVRHHLVAEVKLMNSEIRDEPGAECDRRFFDERGHFVQSDEEFFAEMVQPLAKTTSLLLCCIGGQGMKPEA